MTLTFSERVADAIPLVAVNQDRFDAWVSTLDKAEKRWVASAGFKAEAGKMLLFQNADGHVAKAAFGMGGDSIRKRSRFVLAMARTNLPKGIYDLSGIEPGPELDEAALGWLLSGYRFDRYAAAARPKAELVAPSGIDQARIESIAAGEALSRDLINTPASDMGPAELEAASRTVADKYGAEITVVQAGELEEQRFPMVHAVGRASNRAPRLIDMRWGDTGPKLTLVGKGVCFDTGGLNIKPGASMGLMKKDMGGSAVVLGLAQMIMALAMPLQLRVIIPAVENSINGDAFRPQDILKSRKGLTVEALLRFVE